MSEMRHTPGEWFREGLTIYALDEGETNNRFYTQVQGGWSWRSQHRDGGGHRTSPEELEANARLIAAAPDLLDALVECLREHSGFTIKGECERKARAAIAKAIGETP